MNLEQMVERFQCPGCVCGSDTKCGKYVSEGGSCKGHVLGTKMLGIGNFALGLPKGFNRAGHEYAPSKEHPHRSQMHIRLWPEGTEPEWNHLNIPVWALEGKHTKDSDHDGFLFVRTYQPRINHTIVEVIEGGTLDLVPNATDVSKFFDDID